MPSFAEDLESARRVHGGHHSCHGLVLGVRLARLGCRLLGLEDPRDYRDLLVYVEMDRCAADAVSGVTGTTLGRRRLKWVDYGKFAASFVDLGSGRAVRVWARSDAPHGESGQDAEAMWAPYTDEELFGWDWVEVVVPAADRPGPPVARVCCQACGEEVRDGRQREVEGRTLCRACAQGAYYTVLSRPDEPSLG